MTIYQPDDSGPAFPAPDLGEQDFGQRAAYPGISMRDYFAAKALQGLLARPRESMDSFRDFSSNAYECADEMLKARGQ